MPEFRKNCVSHLSRDRRKDLAAIPMYTVETASEFVEVFG
jgi:hypothetical protein